MSTTIRSSLILYSVFFSVDCIAEMAQTTVSNDSLSVNQEQAVLTIFKDQIALTRSELDQLRGGFIDKSGFKISIGFEKVVAVNGKLQAKSRFYIPTLNLNRKNKLEVKELAMVMDALHERLENNDYKGNVSETEAGDAKDSLGNAAVAINGQLANAPKPEDNQGSSPVTANDSHSLTTRESNGGDQYTDALLSMLNGSQTVVGKTVVETATPTPPTPVNMNTLIQNTQDSSLIQSFQMLNIKIDNLGQYRSKSVNGLVLPQIVNSLR